MIIDKKLSWTVKSKLEMANQKVVVNLVPNVPEDVEYSSPGEGIFITVPKDQCVVNVGDVVEGILVAQVEVPDVPETPAEPPVE